MAYEVYRDRSILDLSYAETLQIDWGNRKENVTVEQASDAFHIYVDLILFLEDWASGTVNVTYRDYFDLPATLLDFKRLHKSLVNISAKEKLDRQKSVRR